MKADKFDDAIRRKLESIVPSQSETDIEQVHRFIQRNRPPTFWGKYGSLLSYSAVAGLVASLFVVILTQRYENKNLQKQLAVFQKNNPTTTATQSKVNEGVALKDTAVAISIQPTQVPNGVLVNPETQPTQSLHAEEEVIHLKPKNILKSIDNERVANNKTETGVNVKAQANRADNSSLLGFEEKKIVQKRKGLRIYAKVSNRVEHSGRLLAEKELANVPAHIQKTTEDGDFEEIKETKSIAEKQQLAFLSNKNITLKNQTYNPQLPQSLITVSNEGTQIGGWSLSLKNISYRAGVGTDIGMGMGFGVVVDAFLTERLSLNTGVRVFSAFEDDFDNDYNFRVRKAQDFRALYAPRVMPNQDIQDIRINDRVIQIPINLVYHTPLGNNFSLTTSVGTDLDVSAKKSVRYAYRDFNGLSRPDAKDSLQTVSVFNNLTASVGIEKQMNRFVFQAAPFLSKQVKDVPYKSADWQWGVRLRVLYDFGKK